MFDHTNLPADFAGVPGLFIPFTGLTAEDIGTITAITRRRRPDHETVVLETVLEPAPGRPTRPVPELPETTNSTQPAAASAHVKWELGDVDIVLACLEHAPNGSIRGLAIRAALNRDGTITRDQIYQLGYPQDRALKGFSRPVESAIRALTGSGKLPPAVRAPLLSPYYDYGSAGTATGYRVPPDLLKDWKARAAGVAGQAA